ncbi:hypothetical protein T484DRAFT_1941853, partial [Baffinella frigidus]
MRQLCLYLVSLRRARFVRLKDFCITQPKVQRPPLGPVSRAMKKRRELCLRPPPPLPDSDVCCHVPIQGYLAHKNTPHTVDL